MTDNNQVNVKNKILCDYWIRILEWMSSWIKTNPLWATAHFFNLVVAIGISLLGTGNGVPIISVVIFMCIIFVQIYTEPVQSIPVEVDQKEREKLEGIRSEQRNQWMIFAYSFMLISLLLTFYPFINSLSESDLNKYLKTLREKPIAVFVGCSLDSKAESLRCEPQPQSQPQDKKTTATGNDKTTDAKPDSASESNKKDEVNANPPAKIDKKDEEKKTTLPEDGKNDQAQPTSSAGVGYAWVINIGGYIKECNRDSNEKYGKSITCEVKDGLLIPLYFIIMALMGGSISLTRRLPELQKQAGSEHIATDKQPRLSQYEFREHLIFQMVQFISAPFLAILAYYLIEPSNITNAVVLAFTAGFASETILLMVRSVANKITPETNTVPQYGGIAGIIKFEIENEEDRQKVENDRKKMEVLLTELPHLAHAIVDEQCLYTLTNVPVGEHSISIKFVDSEKIIKKDIVKVTHAQAIAKKNITITKKEMEGTQVQPQDAAS